MVTFAEELRLLSLWQWLGLFVVVWGASFLIVGIVRSFLRTNVRVIHHDAMVFREKFRNLKG